MALSVAIELQPSAVNIQAGDEALVAITVRNQSKDVGQYELRAEGVEPAWVRFEPAQIGAFPEEEANARLRLRPPQGTPSATYPVTVTVRSLLNPLDQAQATLSLAVGAPASAEVPTAPAAQPAVRTPTPVAPQTAAAAPPAMRAASPGSGQLELTCDRDSVTLLAGAQARLNLSLHNAGGTSLTVDLSTKGFPASWLALSAATVPLAPGQSAPVTLTLSPVALAPAGSYPLTILAAAREDATIAVRLSLVIEVAESGGLAIQIEPPQAEGQVSAAYQVQVTQTAASPLRVRLSAADSQGACSYTFDPEVIVVPPAGGARSKLTVTALRGITGGEGVAHVFTVTVAGVDSGAAISQAQGRFVQRRPRGLSVAVEPAEGRGPAKAVYAVRVANSSQMDVSVTLSASDPKGACTYEIAPAAMTLPAGGEAVAHLTVTPTAYHAGPSDVTHTFTVLAEPSSSLLGPARGEGRFVQTATASPRLAVIPSSQMSAGAGRFTLQVGNPRREPMQVSLGAADDAQACTFAITPQRLTIPAGGQATARLTVTPKSGLLRGESRRVNAFRVTAQTPDLSEPAVAQGSLVQSRRERGGGIIWVLVILVVLLLAAALVLLLLPGGPLTLPALPPSPTPAPAVTNTAGPDMVSTAKAVRSATETAIAQATLEQHAYETKVADLTRQAQEAGTAAAQAAANRQTATAAAQAAKATKESQLTGTAVAKAVADAQATAAAAQTKAATTPTSPPLAVVIVHPAAGEYQPAATTQLNFEVRAWNPAVGTTNGAGVLNVVLSVINSANVVVYQTTDATVPYCLFGGSTSCNSWVFADHGKKWPNGQAIVSGTYTLQARVTAGDGRSRTVSVTVRIQV